MTQSDLLPATLGRAAAVLDALAGSRQLTLSEIVRSTGIPRSSAHRLLGNLVALRWLRRDEGRYMLGVKLFELGSVARDQDRLCAAAIPAMCELSQKTGLTVHLGVRAGLDVIYLERILGRVGAGLPSRIGARRPAHSTSLGKVLLAHSSEATLELLSARPLARHTPFTVSSAAKLREELRQVRAAGVAVDRDGTVLGLSCVGAPVGPPGSVVGAISVAGRSAQLKSGTALVGLVRYAAGAIWNSYREAVPRATPAARPEEATDAYAVPATLHVAGL
ncbi:IclR family transcriptional regulator [Mycolicibacterium sp. HK-90]|uniref:IclR family transcriptional regulator n=1 Tax=Mycolicibacterium sp. HK-90 TaxID=3056937 RepID=UPI00265B1C3A|nr:IclR family transcriptional regulator [Mycolicibacterium sp. HK-90]WKG04885.1 IclR family transcriptional regulator [Mycolicibacterium sp. HK-90]